MNSGPPGLAWIPHYGAPRPPHRAEAEDGTLVLILRPHIIASPEDLRRVYDEHVDLGGDCGSSSIDLLP